VISRLLDKLARWYFVNYMRPVAQEWLYAELAKVELRKQQELNGQGTVARKRYIGE
jgi:hypothetical protein